MWARGFAGSPNERYIERSDTPNERKPQCPPIASETVLLGLVEIARPARPRNRQAARWVGHWLGGACRYAPLT